CGRLLLGADDVRVLATSREPLRIAGEARYRLGPLTLPDQETPGNPADQATGESEAVTLFADRARRADPAFALDQQTRKTVAELAVPRLVDRSLLVPPRTGPDGRTRYVMLETLRAYGAGLLAEAAEDGEVTAALARYAADVAEQASAGLYTRAGEAASLRQLD